MTAQVGDPIVLYIIKHNMYYCYYVYAGVPERPKGEDLRSSGIGLRGFESLPLHYLIHFKKKI